MIQEAKASGYTPTPPTEQPSSGEPYLYDPLIIAVLREHVDERPVVIFNGMDTIYAPKEGDPNGERVPFEGVQETIRAIREQVPNVFIIGWTGKGPRLNVENAVGGTVDLVIGESNLEIPHGKSEEEAKIGYSRVVKSAYWLTTGEQQDLITHGPSPSIKDPQLFARGRIVIVDNDRNRKNNIPGNNNPSVTFINSDKWATSRALPRNLATRVAQQFIKPPSRRQ